MKKIGLLVSIVAVVVLMAGWTWFGGQQEHNGVDVGYSNSPDWGQRATGSWALESESVQTSSSDWTHRATGSWALESDSVQTSSSDWTQRATGSWAVVSKGVLVGSQ